MSDDLMIFVDDLTERVKELEAENETLKNAIRRHFAGWNSTDWVAIIVNGDEELQAVDEVMEGDDVIIDDREVRRARR